MASISSVTPDMFDQLGGTELVIEGTFTVGRGYTVSIGARECYGRLGNGYLCYSADGTTLRAVTPPIPSGESGAPTLTVFHTLEGSASIGVTVVEAAFGDEHHARRLFPPWAGVGPRRLEIEPRRQLT